MDGIPHALLAAAMTLAAGRISGWWRARLVRIRHSI